MMNVFGIGAVKNLRIFFHRMIVHRSVWSIVYIVIPFVQAHTPSHVVILPWQFGGKEELVDTETWHTALHIPFVRGQCPVRYFPAIAVRQGFLFHRHGSLVEIRTQCVVILHIHSPLQPVIPFVTVQQCELITFAGSGVIKTCLFHLARTYIHIDNVRNIGKIRRSTETESGNFFHTAVAHINKRCAGSGIWQPVTIAVMVDSRQLSATFMVELCQSKLIDLCAVLILGETEFERTRVKVLINASAVEPVLADAAV